MFADVTNYKNNDDWLYLLTAVVLVDIIAIIGTKYAKPTSSTFGVKALNDWYTQFGILAVAADVLSILIGIFFARFIYGWIGIRSIYLFLAVLVGFQLFHDIIFYLFVVLPLPKGENAMIDVFKAYGQENGTQILFVDALMMLGSVGIASFLKGLSEHYTTGTLLVALYSVCYFMYTRSA
jgi:hypothetical protein